MANLGKYNLDDTLIINAETTNAAGNPADADADPPPAWVIYEMTDDAYIINGPLQKRDDVNTDGQYKGSVTLAAASGFEEGKSYKIRKTASIAGQLKAAYDTFRIAPAIGASETPAPVVTNYTALVTEPQVRRHLLGIKGVLDELPEGDIAALIAESIEAAQSEFEQETHVWLWPRKIKTFPEEGEVKGVDYDLVEPQYDYHTANYVEAGFFRLRHRPVISVERVAVEYGPGRALFTYPANWMRVDNATGTLSLIPPGVGGFAFGVSGAAGEYWLPLLRGGWLKDVTPILVSIDYTAGLVGAAELPEFATLRRCIAQMAAITVRQALTEIIPNSAGRDGVSVSFGNSVQQFTIMQEEVARVKEEFRKAYGVMRVIWI